MVDVAGKMVARDPVLKKKWERVFTTFFGESAVAGMGVGREEGRDVAVADLNKSNTIDYGDFDILFQKVKELRGEKSTEYTIACDAMGAVWRGLVSETHGTDMHDDIPEGTEISMDQWDTMWARYNPVPLLLLPPFPSLPPSYPPLPSSARCPSGCGSTSSTCSSSSTPPGTSTSTPRSTARFLLLLPTQSPLPIPTPASCLEVMTMYGVKKEEAEACFEKFAKDGKGKPVKKVSPSFLLPFHNERPASDRLRVLRPPLERLLHVHGLQQQGQPPLRALDWVPPPCPGSTPSSPLSRPPPPFPSLELGSPPRPLLLLAYRILITLSLLLSS